MPIDVVCVCLSVFVSVSACLCIKITTCIFWSTATSLNQLLACVFSVLPVIAPPISTNTASFTSHPDICLNHPIFTLDGCRSFYKLLIVVMGGLKSVIESDVHKTSKNSTKLWLFCL